VLRSDRSQMEGGKVAITYERSPIMSTYLVAFVVGEMDHIEKLSEDGVLVRVFSQKVRNHTTRSVSFGV